MTWRTDILPSPPLRPDNCTVAAGGYSQKVTYQGNAVDGDLRSTHVAVRRDGQWFLAGIQLSTIEVLPGFQTQSTTSCAENRSNGNPLRQLNFDNVLACAGDAGELA